MKKVNFDNLINIEVPQSLIESALNVPSEQPKRRLLPARFNRFAAGAAACAVTAAATVLLMLGINKTIDITAPNLQTSSQSKVTNEATEPTSAAYTGIPSTPPPLLYAENAQSAASATEPAENNVCEGAPQSNGRTQTSGINKPDKIKKNSVSSAPQPSADEPVVTEPQDIDPPQTEPEEQPPAEEPAYSGGEEPQIPSKDEYDVLISAYEAANPEQGSAAPFELQGNRYSFNTTIPSSYLVGNIFCLIENDKGQILGNGGLYSKNRELTSYSYEGDKVRLTFECYCIFYYGKTYTVNFYNSHGEMLKKGTITINGDFYREI